MNIYQYGDTVRFECVFYNFEGEKIDPQLIKVIIYDQKYKELKSEVLTSVNKKDIGEYFYDYTTPKKEQKLYYEWYGEIDGTPSLRRGSFMTKFI
ncbi:hypothetical protein [Bacillus phage vB_BanS-Thrax2]|nr:hypothetical protein [Bacillus phage vB_BanS-Thrax2]